MHRDISADQARAILAILKETCGYRADVRAGEYFVASIIVPRVNDSAICHEFRFQGALGSGGKFRNNGNNGNVPHVDCYPEDATPERERMIKKANGKIAKLFT